MAAIAAGMSRPDFQEDGLDFAFEKYWKSRESFSETTFLPESGLSPNPLGIIFHSGSSCEAQNLPARVRGIPASFGGKWVYGQCATQEIAGVHADGKRL